MEESKYIIKFEQLPKDVRSCDSVILAKTLFVSEKSNRNLRTDILVYWWNFKDGCSSVFCSSEDFVREVGEASSLQEALKLMYKDLILNLYWFPKKPIMVVE